MARRHAGRRKSGFPAGSMEGCGLTRNGTTPSTSPEARMTRREDLAAVKAALERLDTAVTTLRARYGDTLGMRRLATDVERVADDIAELGDPSPNVVPPQPTHLEPIPDEPYDPSMWAGADDEGLGAPDRRAP